MRTLSLTQGLSAAASKKSSGDWQRIVMHRFLEDYSRMTSSDSTEQAEFGLGFPPSSYWYVGRVHNLYGRVLMAWSSRSDQFAGALVTPFDTGGLWHGKIEAEPSLTSEEARQKFVRESSINTQLAHDLFFDWLDDGFSECYEYVGGLGPPMALLDDRLKPSENNPFSWSWEVRYARHTRLPEQALRLEKVFWPEEDYFSYLAYLRNEIEDEERYRACFVLAKATAAVYVDLNEARQEARKYMSKELSS